MMEKVVCEINPELEKESPQKWPSLVTITTKSGRKYSAEIEFPNGDPENPLSWEELIQKFKILAAPVYSVDRQKKIVDGVRSLEDEKDMNSFAQLLPA